MGPFLRYRIWGWTGMASVQSLLPKGVTLIAQCLSFGLGAGVEVSPEGTADRARIGFQPSLRDLRANFVGQPKAEALGYCHTSLRDGVKILWSNAAH